MVLLGFETDLGVLWGQIITVWFWLSLAKKSGKLYDRFGPILVWLCCASGQWVLRLGGVLPGFKYISHAGFTPHADATKTRTGVCALGSR